MRRLEPWLQPERCLACAAAAEAEQRWLRWFFIENYGSWATWEQLARGGFCLWHARRIAADREAPTVSSAYEYLLRVERARLVALRRALERAAAPPWPRPLARWRWRRRARRLPRAGPHAAGGCPICRAMSAGGDFALLELRDALRRAPDRAAVLERLWLCRHHLRQALAECDPELARELLDAQLRRVDGVLAELREYFRKLDYRFAHEPKGQEVTAWRRAMALYDGAVSSPEEGATAAWRTAP